MTWAVRAVNSTFSSIYGGKIRVPEIFPQFVKSVTFPTVTVRAEPYRRGSLPYNMPSWDEPLEPVRIVFLAEQNSIGQSSAYTFLTHWLALVRRGRGSRTFGGPQDGDEIPGIGLQTTADFRFNFEVHLLRGGGGTTALISPSAIVAANEAAQLQRAADRRLKDALKVGNLFAGFSGSPLIASGFTSSRIEQMTDLQIASTYRVQQAWLAGFKVSDLNYQQSDLMTLEATFYPESVHVPISAPSEAILP